MEEEEDINWENNWTAVVNCNPFPSLSRLPRKSRADGKPRHHNILAQQSNVFPPVSFSEKAEPDFG